MNTVIDDLNRALAEAHSEISDWRARHGALGLALFAAGIVIAAQTGALLYILLTR